MSVRIKSFNFVIPHTHRREVLGDPPESAG